MQKAKKRLFATQMCGRGAKFPVGGPVHALPLLSLPRQLILPQPQVSERERERERQRERDRERETE